MVVIRAIGFANGGFCPHAGQYLMRADFDAYGGQGHMTFTPFKAKAMKFDDVAKAIIFWRTQSTVRPLRPDGKPNRPLTALTVEMDPVPN